MGEIFWRQANVGTLPHKTSRRFVPIKNRMMTSEFKIDKNDEHSFLVYTRQIATGRKREFKVKMKRASQLSSHV